MITYNEIYEAAKNERYSENLKPIPKNFIKDVSKYLKEKKEVASKGDVFSEESLKTKKQLENAITLFYEFLRRRRKKILNLVLIASETGISQQDFDNMFLIEKALFDDLMKCIESSDRKLSDILNGGEEGISGKNALIVFLEEVGEFVAPDNNSYGPYNVGQFVNLPKEIAKIFLEDGVAESMES